MIYLAQFGGSVSAVGVSVNMQYRLPPINEKFAYAECVVSEADDERSIFS
jgi:hypothetical protein